MERNVNGKLNGDKWKSALLLLTRSAQGPRFFEFSSAAAAFCSNFCFFLGLSDIFVVAKDSNNWTCVMKKTRPARNCRRIMFTLIQSDCTLLILVHYRRSSIGRGVHIFLFVISRQSSLVTNGLSAKETSVRHPYNMSRYVTICHASVMLGHDLWRLSSWCFVSFFFDLRKA